MSPPRGRALLRASGSHLGAGPSNPQEFHRYEYADVFGIPSSRETKSQANLGCSIIGPLNLFEPPGANCPCSTSARPPTLRVSLHSVEDASSNAF
eukprot:525642-Pelagomonas_calceolata.AAC.1